MSLAARATAALILTVGFYALAIGIAVGLLWILIFLWEHDARAPYALFWCVTGAGIIIWSILPRFDSFKPPGPRIENTKHPKLFAELSAVAQASGQSLPDEVYLSSDVNAWVAQRGGLMGFGSRRVMTVGLPVIAFLTVSQLRAVVAHEFGHFHANDTRLAPWIFTTRSAILRTLNALEKRKSILTFLFKAYGHLFIHLTQAISRAQEYAADMHAARVAGANAMIEALKKLYCGKIAWMSYFESDVMPIVLAGYTPPISGLHQFFESTEIKTVADASLERELRTGQSEPTDSHPTLSERVTALSLLSNESAQDDRIATDLLDNVEAVGSELFCFLAGQNLMPVEWNEVFKQVWLPMWHVRAHEQREALQSITAGTLQQELYSGTLRLRLKKPEEVLMLDRERSDVMVKEAAGSALALALLMNAWALTAPPGEVCFIKNKHRMKPFRIVNDLANGVISQQEWLELCNTTGITNLSLALEDICAGQGAGL